MDIDDLIPIGQILKSHGIKGELVIAFESQDLAFDNRIETVWLGESPDHQSPWNVEYLDFRGKNAILKLNRIGSKTEADYLQGLILYVSRSYLSDLPACLSVGYTIKHAKTGDLIGQIIEIDTNHGQTLLYVQSLSGEAILPVAPELIVDIDHSRRIITLQIEEGLLD
jgi:16S rRNA processing protein RimM